MLVVIDGFNWYQLYKQKYLYRESQYSKIWHMKYVAPVAGPDSSKYRVFGMYPYTCMFGLASDITYFRMVRYSKSEV